MSVIKESVICGMCAKLMEEAEEVRSVISEGDVMIPCDPTVSPPVIDAELLDLIRDIDIATAEMLDAEEANKTSRKVFKNLKKKLKKHQHKK